MQQHRLRKLQKLNFRLEFHGARRAGLNAGITTGAGGNLELNQVMPGFVSGSGDGLGWANIFTDRAEDAVVVDGWNRPVLLRFVGRAWFDRELAPLPFVWNPWSLERGHNSRNRVLWYDLCEAAFAALKDFFERIASRDGFGWCGWDWRSLSGLSGLMFEHTDIQWFASQVLAVRPGNLEDVLEAFWHGWATNFAGGAVGSDQL